MCQIGRDLNCSKTRTVGRVATAVLSHSDLRAYKTPPVRGYPRAVPAHTRVTSIAVASTLPQDEGAPGHPLGR